MANRLKTQIQFSDDAPVLKMDEPEVCKRFEDYYQCLQTLGQGAHAVVKIAKKRSTGEIYAVKIVRSGDQEIQSNVKRTFNNTRCLKHPNIAQDIELYINEKMETSHLVMEYCKFPSLESIIKKRPLTPEELKIVIKQLLLGIQHAHSKGICHRDLKPDNILVNLDGDSEPPNVKIVDFGVSRRFSSKGQQIEMLTKTGNIFYCAPEIYHKAGYSNEVDIWAIGVITYQCIFQKLPLHSNELTDFIELLGNQNEWRFQESLNTLEQPLSNLIMAMLNPNKSERITVDAALQHPFFQISTIKDVMAFINKLSVAQNNRCQDKQLQSSLKLDDKLWGNVIQKLQNSQNGDRNDEIMIEDLIKSFSDIHIIEKNGEQCGFIQLMNSINSSTALMSRLGSKQEILDRSFGYQFSSSSNKLCNQDQLENIDKIESSIDMRDDQQSTNNNKFLSQLGAHLDKSIDVMPYEGLMASSKYTPQQDQFGIVKKPSNQDKNLFEDFFIKEVDETTEDSL
ncbi:unnamed protein product (macronuclear) [Paramecium tetraurelia]|uniref:Protein kinase domain-containing protein n=1 Tax=Paramecium tetraurelia TaxID=5888 RepID=A0DEZ0_PARTE|nr:uncharacterized protein GSPATT00016433001 [Paramecium tetraurelia]CAK81607.1 unnamed protein product [Paramecium tetraurelia]|eukprot:XP_001449004.1 hypothetical protein (macronuclear) [Paramecium tetraurelia strain d4-2]